MLKDDARKEKIQKALGKRWSIGNYCEYCGGKIQWKEVSSGRFDAKTGKEKTKIEYWCENFKEPKGLKKLAGLALFVILTVVASDKLEECFEHTQGETSTNSLLSL